MVRINVDRSELTVIVYLGKSSLSNARQTLVNYWRQLFRLFGWSLRLTAIGVKFFVLYWPPCAKLLPHCVKCRLCFAALNTKTYNRLHFRFQMKVILNCRLRHPTLYHDKTILLLLTVLWGTVRQTVRTGL